MKENTAITQHYPASSATLLFEEANKRDLHPKWETDYGLFSLEIQGKKHYLFFSKLPFNSQLSSEFAKNKQFTHLILDQANVRTIPYCVPKDRKEAEKFLHEHKIIVAKPTIGERSHQVNLLSNASQLKEPDLKSKIVEKYIDGQEVRYLVLFDQVIGVLHKHAHPLPNRPWHKLNETIEKRNWDTALVQKALTVAKILELHWCAVDFIIDLNGKAWVLEVNSAPGIKFFHHPEKGRSVDVAQLIVDKLESNYKLSSST